MTAAFKLRPAETEAHPALLGVERSARGFRWAERLDPSRVLIAASIAQVPVGRSWNPADMWENVVGGGEYDAVVVTVDGVWQGRPVSYERAYANECVKNAGSTSVFTF